MSRFSESLLQFGVSLMGAALFLLVAVLLVRGVHPALERGLAVLRPSLGWLDHRMARNVAAWIGLDETTRWRRWGRLLGVLIGAAAIGALTPPALGAPVLIGGLVAVLAVFRRWAWDEEDRAAGLPLDRRRLSGNEDYNNELVVALSAVFMLGSLLVWRLTGLRYFSDAAGIGLLEYLAYVSSEALEAVPIIGNVEVLGYDNPSGVQAVLPTGGGVAFVLRMALDLLVIGGLFQILAVARRIARGQDLRRFEEIIQLGEANRVGEALRSLGSLAMGGDPKALGLLQGVAADEVGSPNAPLARVQALHQLAMVADVLEPLASSIRTHRRTAIRVFLEHPDLASSGYKPLVYKQLSEDASWFAYRHHGQAALDDMTEAVTALAHAIVTPGYSATAAGALAQEPRAMAQEERASLTVLYADLLLTAGEWSPPRTAQTFFERGVGMVEAALEHLEAMPDPYERVQAWRLKGQLLTRLGAANGGEEGRQRLGEALAAYDEAERALASDHRSAMSFVLCADRGVTHECLGQVAEQTAFDHFRAAADLFAEASEGFEALDAERSTLSLAFINQGNAALLASEALAAAPESEPVQVLEWIDRALASFLRGAVLALEAAVDRMTIDSHDGIARASLARYRYDGDEDHLLMVVSARRLILGRHDERADPSAWALAALECSRAELAPSRRSGSGAMALAALQRLERARPILVRFHLEAEADHAESLMIELRDIAERLEGRSADDAGGGDHPDPRPPTLH